MSNKEQIDVAEQTAASQIQVILNTLINNGIHVDKNLRQPTYYTWINYNELNVECFAIISDLLMGQRIPLWLAQRIAWHYSNKHFQQIVADLSLSAGVTDPPIKDEAKSVLFFKVFHREKLVIYLRKTIPDIINEWLNEKSRLTENNTKNLMFLLTKAKDSASKPLSYYDFGMKNKRRVMEDKTSIYDNIDIFDKSFLSSFTKSVSIGQSTDSKRPNALFAVFDGHCGTDCAQYVSTHLPIYIIQNFERVNAKFMTSCEFSTSISQLLENSFDIINQRFTQKATTESIKGGTTCCLCIASNYDNQKSSYSNLSVAWCGDTQMCLVKKGQISFMTPVHKPENETEKKRIEKMGGSVSFTSNAWRVNGSLGVARAFGDIDYQSYGVTSQPDIKNIKLDGDEDYFIIGCDGLWENLNLSELCKLIYDNKDNGADIAELLVRNAKDNGSSDNITAIFVLLKSDLSQISPPAN